MRVQDSFIFQCPQQLARIERVPFSPLFKVALQPSFVRLRQGIPTLDQCPMSALIQGTDVQPLGARFPHQQRHQVVQRVAASDLVTAIGGDQQDSLLRDLARQNPREIELAWSAQWRSSSTSISGRGWRPGREELRHGNEERLLRADLANSSASATKAGTGGNDVSATDRYCRKISSQGP